MLLKTKEAQLLFEIADREIIKSLSENKTNRIRFVEAEAFNRGFRITKNGIMLNPLGNKIGYLLTNSKYYEFKIKERKTNKTVPVSFHRMQAFQKFGNLIYEDGLVVRHLNNNSFDNSFNNIGIGTDIDNIYDVPKKERILNCLNSTKVTRKYSQKIVDEIRVKHSKGYMISFLSNQYSIPESTIHNFINIKYLQERIDQNLI